MISFCQMLHLVRFVAALILLFASAQAYDVQNSSLIPKGVLAPIGGGATQVDSSGFFLSSGDSPSGVKDSQRQIFSDLRAVFNELRGSYSELPEGVCLVSYLSDSSQDLAEEFGPMQTLLVASGFKPAQILFVSFTSRQAARSKKRVDDFSRRCGFVYLPGGDQTAQVNIWSETRFQEALSQLYFSGGVISGKSAGAAVLGKWVFTPDESRDTVVSNFLGEYPINEREMRRQPLIGHGHLFPDILFETHTGDRERSARAAVFFGYLNQLNRRAPLVISLDSDTGIVLRAEPLQGPAVRQQLWSMRVLGYRSVEVFSALQSTVFGNSIRGRIEVGNGRSDLLEPGDVALLSSDRSVVEVKEIRQGDAQPEAGAGNQKHLISSCLSAWGGDLISGASLDVREKRSRKWFRAAGNTSIEDAEYAYLTGLVTETPLRAEGCGLWLSGAFNADVGKPENRLNLLRYGLSKGIADVAFALSAQTQVKVGANGSLLQTETQDALSLFVLDARPATRRRISRFVYKDLGGVAPLQTGRWTDGRFHLVGPGSSIQFVNGAENRFGRNSHAGDITSSVLSFAEHELKLFPGSGDRQGVSR